jgi:ribosomal protein S18 acetylase RimI-like enzyme
MNHLRTWPELAIVAEAVCLEDDEADSAALSSSSSSSSSSIGSNRSNNPRPLVYSPFSTNQYSNNYNTNKFSEPTIVAYVIGKVEERTVFLDQEAQLLRMQQDSDDNGYYSSVFQKRSHQRQQQQQPPLVPQYTIERFGHVTSLAVLEPYRRLGLARDLMKQLHHHMAACYTATSDNNNNNNNIGGGGASGSGDGGGGVESVGLHVRQSNLAAASLYQKFGYEITQRIPHYYQDGEDAYLMTKRLSDDTQIQQQQQQQRHGGSGVRGNIAVASLFPSSVFGSFRSPPRPWDKNFGVPLDLQLPRVIHCTNSNNDNDNVYSGSNSLRRNELQQQSQQDLVDYTTSSTSTSTTPELLTGTM